MTIWDWLVIAGYFGILALVVICTRRKQESAADFFLGGRSVGWLAVGASIFAANIGSEHLIGLAGSGASCGLSMSHWEYHAWIIVMMSWVFLPFYYKSGVSTMPEFLERRFGPRARWILSLVSLSAYVLTKISVTVFAGALFFEVMLPEMSISIGGSEISSFWIGAFATVALAGIYSAFGGLLAVVYTDLVQTAIILVGTLSITAFALYKLGGTIDGGTIMDGWSVMKDTIRADPETVKKFSLWHELSHPTLPWLGVIIASATSGIWYWCTDQFIIQRTLAARNLANARRGAMWGAFLKLLPVFLFLIPGMLGFALHRRGVISIPLLANGEINADTVFPTLVQSLLPVGFRGLVVAGMIAALMSSLASLFNSVSTLFTVDIYQKLKPNATGSQLVRVGRVTTVLVTMLGIIWVPIMKFISTGGLYQYLQSVQGFLAAPIVAVFILGIFWKRCNLRGATWGLGLGFVLGMAKLTINTVCKDCGGVLGSIVAFSDYYFIGALLAISLLIVAIASLTAPVSDPVRLNGYTFACLDADFRREVRESWNWRDVAASAIILGLVAGCYLYFWNWL